MHRPLALPKLSTPYLMAVQGKSMAIAKELTAEDAARIKSVSEVLTTHNSDFQLLLAAEWNHKDLKKLLSDLLEETSKNLPNDMFSSDKININVNRHLINLLSTVRTFLDHYEAKLKRRHGKDSGKVQAFKRATADAYDGCFSYRFMYSIRNYVQHCGMPVGSIGVERRLSEEGDGQVVDSMDLCFCKSSLLSHPDVWKKPLLKEIERLPKKIPISPHVDAMMECLARIQHRMICEEMPEVLDAIVAFREVVKEVLSLPGRPCICMEEPGAVPGVTDLIMSWLPLEIVLLTENTYHPVIGRTQIGPP
jgi:hypothetical protein